MTNPEKVFWPEEGYTKGDVIDYYRRMAPFILPYLKDRPESLHRHPDGISGEAFFQKNVEHQVPDWVKTVSIRSESENRDTLYLLCQDEAALVYMANLGCIEINPWHSRIGSLDSPDFMVLDLDPLDVPFEDVVATALVTHEILAEIGAKGSCKTSGARGLHIYVPLDPGYSYEQSTQFARLVNLAVHARLPRITSVERNPEKRHGRVYLDYLQNRHGQTLVAPYSLRPRKGAPGLDAPLVGGGRPYARPFALHHGDHSGEGTEARRSLERRAQPRHRHGAMSGPLGRHLHRVSPLIELPAKVIAVSTFFRAFKNRSHRTYRTYS